MTKKEFLEKHGFNEVDFRNLERFERVRESGAYNMYEYLGFMAKNNVNGGERLADWIQTDDNYGEFLDLED